MRPLFKVRNGLVSDMSITLIASLKTSVGPSCSGRSPSRPRLASPEVRPDLRLGARLIQFDLSDVALAAKRGETMTVIDDVLTNADQYAAGFEKGSLPLPPAKPLPILACMDARLDPYAVLGLSEGDAHVIRNAGGVVTHDEIRSISISQHLLGTREVMLIHHTDCGMLTFKDEDFAKTLATEAGTTPDWSAQAFSSPEADVREQMKKLKASPFIPHRDQIRGFIYDVRSGRIDEVDGR